MDGKVRDQEVNGKKSDLYSLGASLLTLGINKPIDDCYENKGQFNNDALNRHLCEFDNKYKRSNPMLSKMVWNLTEPDPEKRIDTNQLLQITGTSNLNFSHGNTYVQSTPFNNTNHVVKSVNYV